MAAITHNAILEMGDEIGSVWGVRPFWIGESIFLFFLFFIAYPKASAHVQERTTRI